MKFTSMTITALVMLLVPVAANQRYLVGMKDSTQHVEQGIWAASGPLDRLIQERAHRRRSLRGSSGSVHIYSDVSADVIEYHNVLDGFSAELDTSEVQQLLSDETVAFVELDQPVQASVLQNDATWGIDRVDGAIDGVYDTGEINGEGVDVYIIDTGILADHEHFAGRMGEGKDFIGDGNGWSDCNGHGTHCAGTAAGSVHGIARAATIHAVRVLDCAGSGSYSGVIGGIDWAVEQAKLNPTRPAVASMSLGGGTSAAMNAAVDAAEAEGLTVVVAAGNENANACGSSPASAEGAITVGSTDSSDRRSSFSNYGECVQIFAPGSSITSAWHTSTSSTNTISGTSMACPHVAGVAALELSRLISTNAGSTSTPAVPRLSWPAWVRSEMVHRAGVDIVQDAQTVPNLLLRSPHSSTAAPPAPMEPTGYPTAAPTVDVSVGVVVRVVTTDFGDEVYWHVDTGERQGPYSDHTETIVQVALPEGQHTITLTDTYGDGWHGGYWEVLQSGVSVAGGAVDGQVQGTGGTVTFTIGPSGPTSPPTPAPSTSPTTSLPSPTDHPTPAPSFSPSLPPTTLPPSPTTPPTANPTAPTPTPTSPPTPPAPAPTAEPSDGSDGYRTVVRVVTTDWGNEVFWSVDGGEQHGPYDDYSTNTTPLELEEGWHTIDLTDSFGDGWHGGYFEVRVNDVRVAGGEEDGVVEGIGGTVPFYVSGGDYGYYYYGQGTISPTPSPPSPSPTATPSTPSPTPPPTLPPTPPPTPSPTLPPTLPPTAVTTEYPTYAPTIEYPTYAPTIEPTGEGDGSGSGSGSGGDDDYFHGDDDADHGSDDDEEHTTPPHGTMAHVVVRLVGGAHSHDSTPDSPPRPAHNVHMVANQAQWSLDGGQVYGPFGAGVQSVEFVLALAVGEHAIHLIDTYGDGWGHGSYWEVLQQDGDEGQLVTVAGGEEEGRVGPGGASKGFVVQ